MVMLPFTVVAAEGRVHSFHHAWSMLMGSCIVLIRAELVTPGNNSKSVAMSAFSFTNSHWKRFQHSLYICLYVKNIGLP